MTTPVYYDNTKVGFHSRSLEDLSPQIKVKADNFVEGCREKGISVLIYCTFRDEWEQAKLYRVNRSLNEINIKILKLEEKGFPNLAHILRVTPPQPGGFKGSGPILTKAGPGESAHQHRIAFDYVPLFGGKPVWSDATEKDFGLWNVTRLVADICQLQSLSWEKPHLQQIGFNENLSEFMESRYGLRRNYLPKYGDNPLNGQV